jgi:hypothetical protein
VYALAPDGVASAWGNKNYSGWNRQKRRVRHEPEIHGQRAVERVVFFHFFVVEEKCPSQRACKGYKQNLRAQKYEKMKGIGLIKCDITKMKYPAPDRANAKYVQLFHEKMFWFGCAYSIRSPAVTHGRPHVFGKCEFHFGCLGILEDWCNLGCVVAENLQPLPSTANRAISFR